MVCALARRVLRSYRLRGGVYWPATARWLASDGTLTVLPGVQARGTTKVCRSGLYPYMIAQPTTPGMPPSSAERVEERLGLLEIGGVKPLGEPAVDRCQEAVSLGAFALLLP